MEVTLKELLGCHYFRESEVLAGTAGTDNMVKSVTVMDSPDAYKYMKGGDLVVSSAYFLMDDPKLQEDTVRNLAGQGAAALGLMRRFTGGVVPEPMRVAADELGFPIISLTDSYAYTDIYEFVKYNLLSRVTGEVKREDRVIQEINDAGHEKGLQGILDALQKWTGFPAVVLHESYQTACSDFFLPESFPEDPGKWNCERVRNEGFYEVRCYSCSDGEEPVTWVDHELTTKGQVEGRLVMFTQSREMVDEDFLLFGVAARACSAELKRLHHLVGMQRKYKSEFLKRFFFGEMNWEEALMQARERDIVLPVTGLAVLVDINSPVALETDYDVLNEKFEKIISGIFGKHILFGLISPRKMAMYVNYNKTAYAGQIDLLYELLVKTFPRDDINIGVGRPGGIDSIQTSYQEALAAIVVGACMGFTRQVYHFGDLGFFRLLKLPDVRGELLQYCRDYLDPILKPDKSGEKSYEFLNTLQNYVECCYNYRETGRRMYLHPNTVRYRIGAIEKLCRVNFEQFFDRLNMEIALKIYPLIDQMNLKDD